MARYKIVVHEIVKNADFRDAIDADVSVYDDDQAGSSVAVCGVTLLRSEDRNSLNEYVSWGSIDNWASASLRAAVLGDAALSDAVVFAVNAEWQRMGVSK